MMLLFTVCVVGYGCVLVLELLLLVACFARLRLLWLFDLVLRGGFTFYLIINSVGLGVACVGAGLINAVGLIAGCLLGLAAWGGFWLVYCCGWFGDLVLLFVVLIVIGLYVCLSFSFGMIIVVNVMVFKYCAVVRWAT